MKTKPDIISYTCVYILMYYIHPARLKYIYYYILKKIKYTRINIIKKKKIPGTNATPAVVDIRITSLSTYRKTPKVPVRFTIERNCVFTLSRALLFFEFKPKVKIN